MLKVFCKLTNNYIKKIDKETFNQLETYLISSGLASDKDSFEVIKQRLQNPPTLSPNEFASEVIYVILASGFKQKIAKQKFFEIMEFIKSGKDVNPTNLLPIFGNKNKINAICKVWNNQDNYCTSFYKLTTTDEKLDFLKTLPYIGEIIKNHIARNLGINKVKYDIWIQRLGIALCGNEKCKAEGTLSPYTKTACDTMFENIKNETNLSIGYIDVVLWKSCQIGLFEFHN